MKRSATFLVPLLLLLACAGPDTGPGARELATLPDLDLSRAETGAREQLEAERAELEELIARPETPADELAQAYADLGLLYVTYEFLTAAGVCFENARALEPEDFQWHYLAGYLEMIQGRLPEATARYQQALELEPEYLPAVLRLGRSQLELGRPEPARRWFERALELNSNAAAAHEGMGKAASAAGDHQQAIGHFERALELDPDATGIHYALGQAYRNLGRLEEARAQLALSGDVAARISDPLINPLASLAESAQFYMVQGAEAMDDKDYESAVAAYRATLDKEKSFLAYRGLAIGLERLGDAEGAEKTLAEALVEVPAGNAEDDRRQRATIERSLAGLAALAGREDEALEHYLAALEHAPEQPDVLLRAGNALARRGRFEEAIAHYDRLTAVEPQWTPAILEKRATALVNLGRGDAAVADFTRAVEAVPDDPRLRLRFAEALEFLGDPAAAEAQRAAAAEHIEDDADRLPLVAAAARHLARQGDFTAAIERFREALELDGDDLELRYDLASLLGHTRQLDEAVAEFETLIAAAPRHDPARRGQIAALVLAGRFAEARVKLQEALRTFPRNVDFALLQVRLLATAPDPRVRDGDLALTIARRVYAERQESAVRQALALAYARAGMFAEATVIQRQLLEEAEHAGEEALAAERRSRLDAFQGGEAWTATTAGEILAAG